MLRMLTTRERYYRWDEGRRKTFTVVEVSLPGLRRVAEDYVVERTPGGSRFIWTVALEAGPMLKPMLRLTNPITGWMIRRVARGIRCQVGETTALRRKHSSGP